MESRTVAGGAAVAERSCTASPDVPAGSGRNIRRAESGTAAAPGLERQPALRSARGSRIRLLLADDHPVVRQGLALLFATVADIEVVGVAEDGRAAVELTGSLAPDVVVMDVGMPVLDGIDATRRLTRDWPAVSVILLTGRDDPETRERARLAGARYCLFKDGDQHELIDAVRTSAGHPSPELDAKCGEAERAC